MGETDDKFDSVKDNCNMEDVSASHFALQIALQTMKERCHLLQQRLSAVEEENLHLRIEGQNNISISERIPASEITMLAEKITQLTRQKSQLVDRITMVAKENNQLWSRLSRLTEANQSLGSHLSKISDTLNKHPIGDILNQEESNNASKLLDGDGVDKKEESLEEISLKIIDTIRQEKKVLERQCEEMMKLQSGAVSVEECGFLLTADEELTNGVADGETEMNEDVMDDIRKLREKMSEDYKLLKSQQAGLQAAVASISSVLADKKCLACKGKINADDKDLSRAMETQCTVTANGVRSPLNDINNQLKDVAEPPSSTQTDSPMSARDQEELNNMESNNYEDGKTFDKICPLCSKFYSQKVLFEEFHEHVLSHFSNENEEQDSIVANFEVVT